MIHTTTCIIVLWVLLEIGQGGWLTPPPPSLFRTVNTPCHGMVTGTLRKLQS
ncbi:hypothetical protein PR003_g24326 [Phytophthora rubi]|uniref:RxLR effector protein n=1 Tax=Phytophthora rubi TaxID=129364 RepID=A0A6A3IQP4_9STRA|nr:hypothetical protein PR002_g24121 [Phytophthora rubi]KAE8982464.1 hypothetical protein PR001_g23721 [Phytophthora rubi]KAE9294161.1 hypothetical protein PR003_g24326 [Phytophthora rubi]